MPGSRRAYAPGMADPRPWWRIPPPVTDALLALLVLAFTLIGALGESYPSNPTDRMANGDPIAPAPASAYLLIVVAAAALAVRRRCPISALVVSLLAALTWTALGYPNGAMVMVPMVALYTVVAVRGRVRDGLILGAVTAGLIVGAGAIWGPFGPLGGGQTVTPFVVAAARSVISAT